MDTAGADSAAPMEAAIAANIRAALKASPIENKTQLANITGINYQTLRFRLEAGSGIKFNEITRIAAALGTVPTALIPRDPAFSGAEQ